MALAAVLAASIATGCGGSDEPTPKESAAPAATAASEETPEGGGSSSGNVTKPGSEIAVGDTAHVNVSALDATSDDAPKHPLDATVLKIERGSIDDFKGIDLEPEQEASTPYYVTVRLEATKGAVPTKDDPDIRFDAIDDRDQEQGSVTFLGSFPRCEDKTAPKTLKAGDTHESCLVYLVPGGGSIEKVGWSGSSDYISDPVIWK